MLPTKYQSSKPFNFREKKIEVFLLSSNVSVCDQHKVCLQGHHMNVLGRGPLRDATYERSKLQAFQFQRVKFYNFLHSYVLNCDDNPPPPPPPPPGWSQF